MAQSGATSWISCDHTFKVAANIRLLRQSDKKWEKQYDSMFCILNEDGTVLASQLTKGTAFDNAGCKVYTKATPFCLPLLSSISACVT